MLKIASIVLAFLTLIAALYSFNLENFSSHNLTFADDECTDKLAAECTVYIERTAKSCAKAFATEGAGIISDIKCVKDLEQDKKKCWPCLCAEAKKEGWHNLDC